MRPAFRIHVCAVVVVGGCRLWGALRLLARRARGGALGSGFTTWRGGSVRARVGATKNQKKSLARAEKVVYYSLRTRAWRNWQTRMVQVHVSFTLMKVQVLSPAPFELKAPAMGLFSYMFTLRERGTWGKGAHSIAFRSVTHVCPQEWHVSFRCPQRAVMLFARGCHARLRHSTVNRENDI